MLGFISTFPLVVRRLSGNFKILAISDSSPLLSALVPPALRCLGCSPLFHGSCVGQSTFVSASSGGFGGGGGGVGGGIGGEIGSKLYVLTTGSSAFRFEFAIVAKEPTAPAAIAMNPLIELVLPRSPATTAATIAEIAISPSTRMYIRPFTYAESSCPARACTQRRCRSAVRCS